MDGAMGLAVSTHAWDYNEPMRSIWLRRRSDENRCKYGAVTERCPMGRKDDYARHVQHVALVSSAPTVLPRVATPVHR